MDEETKEMINDEIELCKARIAGVSDETMLEVNPKIHLKSEQMNGPKKAILLIEVWNGQIAVLRKLLANSGDQKKVVKETDASLMRHKFLAENKKEDQDGMATD